MSIESNYHRYLALTGNEIAAAVLTLAQSRESDGLLTIEAAAELLGYKPAGLRKIVKAGEIRFMQNGRGPIKFRREWIDAYIQSSTPGVERSPSQRHPTLPMPAVAGFDARLFKA